MIAGGGRRGWIRVNPTPVVASICGEHDKCLIVYVRGGVCVCVCREGRRVWRGVVVIFSTAGEIKNSLSWGICAASRLWDLGPCWCEVLYLSKWIRLWHYKPSQPSGNRREPFYFGLALPPPRTLSMICSLARLPARAAVSGNIMFDLMSCKYPQICCSAPHVPCGVLLKASVESLPCHLPLHWSPRQNQ